jgi:ABC-type Mn2+/Zn2+ transport system permease subunit
LIGKSGTTGTEYVGYWAPQHALFAATIYGSPIGMLMCPIGYFLFLRHIPFFKALWVTALGTIVGGCIGALIGSPLAVLTGIAGFFCACVCLGVAEFDTRKVD